MFNRFFCIMLALCLLPALALGEASAFLSGDDLNQIMPAYEAFIGELAELLIARGLLSASEREAWLLYQLGDFVQNGGYGSILTLYTPGLLQIADESVTLRRLTLETSAGTLRLDTLRSYSINLSPLPGLPLDTELTDASGAPIACRFRWTASNGRLLIWDGATGEIVNVGATYIGDGRALYWLDDPVEGVTERLSLEILHPTEDYSLASATLTVTAGRGGWTLSEDALR